MVGTQWSPYQSRGGSPLSCDDSDEEADLLESSTSILQELQQMVASLRSEIGRRESPSSQAAVFAVHPKQNREVGLEQGETVLQRLARIRKQFGCGTPEGRQNESESDNEESERGKEDERDSSRVRVEHAQQD